MHFSLFIALRVFLLLVERSVAFFCLFILLNVKFITSNVNIVRLDPDLEPRFFAPFAHHLTGRVV
jgi:hypothetical protein